MDNLGVHRPRNVDWKRAAALLYGDWGPSKAYVLGLAFVAAGYSSFPIILAVCGLTAVVGYNYIVICKLFPDGGGVYSAARTQSRLLAVMGALLLVANFTVTAAMSGWAAMNYLGVPKVYVPLGTIVVILGIGVLNYYGPKHSGSLAMLSLPSYLAPDLDANWERMLRFLALEYGSLAFGITFGKIFAVCVGIIVGLLLLSAVNTTVAALIGLVFMMAGDGEMPRSFTRLNPQGVPWWPLAIAVFLPISVVVIASDLESLAGLYAIGVVGAITVNLGSCTFNAALRLKWFERGLMGVAFVLLFVVEMTIARTKSDALFFAVCVLGLGLGLRGYAQKRAGLRTLTVSQEMAAAVAPESVANIRPNLESGQIIMVAARGLNPVLRFALEESRLRKATVYVLYVKEVAVTISGPVQMAESPRWQDDLEAAKIMYAMLEMSRQSGVTVIPLYVVSDNAAGTILDFSATMGIDILMLGASHRRTLLSLLKGNVVAEVARNLPENIQLVI